MLRFCGQEKCSIDANGRVKLCPRFIEDFLQHSGGNVVLHCLPEGAIAVYPEEVYSQMRSGVGQAAEKAGLSLVQRRVLRSFGALSQPDQITRQGRLTVPPAYRGNAGLQPGTEIYLVGVEIGIEIWNAARWEQELQDINTHLLQKGEVEMAADLSADNKEELKEI